MCLFLENRLPNDDRRCKMPKRSGESCPWTCNPRPHSATKNAIEGGEKVCQAPFGSNIAAKSIAQQHLLRLFFLFRLQLTRVAGVGATSPPSAAGPWCATTARGSTRVAATPPASAGRSCPRERSTSRSTATRGTDHRNPRDGSTLEGGEVQ